METLVINTEALRMTESDFVKFCIQNRDLRIERDSNKNIFIMSPAFSKTGWWNSEILSELREWNKKSNLGYVFDSSAGFTLPDGAMRSPDASWIKKKRWEALTNDEQESFAPLCPDFVIEIRSKTDSLKQLQDKMQAWIANGCLLGWLIDFTYEKIYIYEPGNTTAPAYGGFDRTISAGKALPGFELNLAAIK